MHLERTSTGIRITMHLAEDQAERLGQDLEKISNNSTAHWLIEELKELGVSWDSYDRDSLLNANLLGKFPKRGVE